MLQLISPDRYGEFIDVNQRGTATRNQHPIATHTHG